MMGTSLPGAVRADTEIVLDTVVASVNGKPITWSDLKQRLRDRAPASVDQASSDPGARSMLDILIMERLVEEDAEARRLGASNEEIDAYISEIAQRNGMRLDGFKTALASEGRDYDEYRQQVRLEILKGKLASAYLRGGVTVSDDEVDAYLKEHPDLSQQGSKVELSQIFVSNEGRTPEEARALLEKAQADLNSGVTFLDVVEKYAEESEKPTGGALGLVNEQELSKPIFNAVLLLKAGQHSEIVETPRGFHIFRVEKRLNDESATETVRGEVRKRLQSVKVDEKLADFFTNELFKNYSVDKKL
jgi:peptidyl-prolyl cis-trans isomerase SurA